MTSVVLGATGGIGSAVVDALVARGGPVRAVSRSVRPGAPGVESHAADVTDPAALAAAVEGADVVYHCAQPAYTRWPELFPPMNRAVVDACARVGATLVFADNLYAYGPGSSPMTESSPQAATDRKGRTRAAMADELLAAHAAGRIRVAIGRVSDYFGPRGVDTGLGTTLFGRALAGKKPQWVGGLDAPHTMSYLPDVGAALVTLGTRPEAAGRIWHLPAGPPLTGREFLGLVSAELGRPVGASVASPGMLRALGLVVPMMRELATVSYQWTAPFVADDSAFRAAFGPVTVTPHSTAVADTVAWWRTRS